MGLLDNARDLAVTRPGYGRYLFMPQRKIMGDITPADNKLMRCVKWGALGLFALFLLTELVFSLHWRMQHDTPLLHYVAFLIDKHHFTPYKDVFETSMPGTILFHLTIGKFLGYSDTAFRIVDFIYLLVFLAVTWFLIKPLSKTVAFASVLIFGLIYLGFGPTMSLQRDYVGTLPIAIALLLITKDFALSSAHTRALIVGALVALSASIKPQLAISLPVLVLYISFSINRRYRADKPSFWRAFLQTGLFATLGFALVFSIPFIWLWATGGFPQFWEMFSSYLPLHVQLTGEHEILTGPARLQYLFDSYRKFGGMSILLIPAALGIYIALSESRDRSKTRFIFLLLTLLVVYSFYPVLSGQFWDYHWMPFAYFGSLCAALVLIPPSKASFSPYRRFGPLIVFVFSLALLAEPSGDFVRQIAGKEPIPPKDGRVDEIAAYLRGHLRPTDKVQPLDWTGGAVHALLISRAVVATPYIYDYHFYHHISKPYIQHLRKNFIERLQAEKPRFIIDVYEKPRPKGKDTTTEFVELQEFINDSYATVYKGNGFDILERRVE